MTFLIKPCVLFNCHADSNAGKKTTSEEEENLEFDYTGWVYLEDVPDKRWTRKNNLGHEARIDNEV